MSAVAEWVGDTVGGAFDSAGKIAEDAVREIGHAAESVGREVGKIGEAAAQNPIGTIAKIGAAASGQWWALPAVSALDVVAHGGNLEQAALSAGVSLAASWAGQGIAGEILAPAADSTAALATADAANMVAQNIPADQISQVLQQSYGITGNIADSIANATTAGVSANTLASAYAGAFGQQLTGVADAFTEKLIATSLGNSAANFGVKLVQTGGDVEKALAAGAGAGIGTAFGGYVAKEMVGAGANNTLSQITGKITAAATSGIVQGQDPGKALGTALVNNIVSTSYAQAGSLFKDAWSQSGAEKLFTDIGTKNVKSLNDDAAAQKTASDKAIELEKQQNGIAKNYDELVKTASSYYNDTVVPAKSETERLQAAANDSYNVYKPLRDQFSNYVSQYDAAKAQYDAVAVPNKQTDDDGNVTNQAAIDEANSQRSNFANQMNDLADKANALVPQINAATNKYNADASTFQASADKLNGIANQYSNYDNQINELKNNYNNVNTQFTDAVKIANDAANRFNTTSDEVKKQVDTVIQQKAEADKVAATLDPEAKKAYQNLFSDGKMPTEAITIGNQVNDLDSTIAQKSFNQSYKEGLDIEQSLKLAQDVNGLAKPQQNYFNFAANTGLNTTDALAVAPTLSSMNVTAQQAFFDQLNNNKFTPTEALSWADKVNALDNKQQIAYNTAVTNGLTHDQALELSPNISTFSASQQAAYVNSIKQGMSNEAADLAAAFSSFSDKYVPTSTVDQDAANLAKLKTDDQKQAYMELVSGAGGLKISPDKAMAFVTQGIDPISGKKVAEDFIGLLTGSGNVQAGELPSTTPTIPKNLVESVYRQDASGKWGEYVPDGKGGFTNTGAVLAGEYTAGPTGSKYVVDQTTDQNGAPTMSMTPYTGTAPPTETPTSSGSSPTYKKSELDSALAAGELTKQEYDQYLSKAVDDTKTPVKDVLAGSSTWQDYINDLLTKSKATTGSGSGSVSAGGTGAGPTTGTGSGTGTTGGPTAGGPTTGTGTGSGTAGTDTGVGGTGTGTGGTGTGTGTGAGTGIGLGGGALLGGTGGYSTWLASQGQDQYGGIKNLTPGLTERMDYTLTGMPNIQESSNPMADINNFAAPQQMATGGSASSTYDPFGADTSGIKSSLTPGLTKAQLQYVLSGMPGSNISVQSHAAGGEIEGHNPTFFSEGGLSSIENRYVQGEGDGTSDSVAAMLADGEFVIPADVVSKLGNGSNEAGAGVLDQFLAEIRKHAQSNGTKLPPESKGPLAYLLDAKRKVKA